MEICKAIGKRRLLLADAFEEFSVKSENRKVEENRQTRKEIFHRFHLPNAHIDRL